MLIADVKQAVQDRYGQIESARFNRYLASAVREYSRWNPRVLEGTVTTIAETREYSLATLTGIVGIKEVRHYPGVPLWENNIAMRERAYLDDYSQRYYQFSLRLIDDINNNELMKAVSGYAYYLTATNILKLADNPPAGETVTVVYYAAHVISSGTAYATIPDMDFDIIRDLTLAEFYEADTFTASLQPDYKEGQESETFSHVSQNGMAVVDKLRGKVKQKYGATGILDVGP